ncbi:hypothetical protein OG589_00160 [Sphaerisporangium sp. NBC_01403]|uniref:hypothetical protein n=1 Tax=Sphaerisporangium sp. NBC_01403 TaxID=2903599 RepID=UPI00324FD4BB
MNISKTAHLPVSLAADELLRDITYVWPIAQSVPDDERCRQPGSAFRHGLAAPEGATRFDQILAMLGRSPA